MSDLRIVSFWMRIFSVVRHDQLNTLPRITRYVLLTLARESELHRRKRMVL